MQCSLFRTQVKALQVELDQLKLLLEDRAFSQSESVARLDHQTKRIQELKKELVTDFSVSAQKMLFEWAQDKWVEYSRVEKFEVSLNDAHELVLTYGGTSPILGSNIALIINGSDYLPQVLTVIEGNFGISRSDLGRIKKVRHLEIGSEEPFEAASLEEVGSIEINNGASDWSDVSLPRLKLCHRYFEANYIKKLYIPELLEIGGSCHFNAVAFEPIQLALTKLKKIGKRLKVTGLSEQSVMSAFPDLETVGEAQGISIMVSNPRQANYFNNRVAERKLTVTGKISY